MVSHRVIAVDRLTEESARATIPDAGVIVFDCSRVAVVQASDISRIMGVAVSAHAVGLRILVIGCLPLVERSLRAVGLHRLAVFRRPRHFPSGRSRALAG